MVRDPAPPNHPRTIDATAAAATDWLALLWRRKLVVVAITAVVLVLGFFYYHRATPIYQSTAQVLLIKNEAELPITGAGGQFSYEDALSTHLILIRSPLIVSRAVAEHRLGSLPSLKKVRDPESAIIDGLEAVRGGTRDAPDPNVIMLSYRSVNPRDCAVVLDAVVQSYQDYLGETYQDYSDQTVHLITRAKDELDRQLAEKEAFYREFRATSPHLLTNPNGDKINIHELRIGEIERARAEQMLKNTQLKARVEAIEAALQRGGHREALTLLAKQSSAAAGFRTPLDAVDRQLIDALLEEQLLLEHFGDDHPDVISTRRKIATLREHSGQVASGDSGEPRDFLAVYLDSLQQEVEVGHQQLAELDELFTSEQEAARALSTYQLADENHRSAIGRLRQLFDGVIKRLEEINLIPEHGGVKTQVISPPGMGEKVEPNLLVIGLLSLLLGMTLGAGGAFVAEKTDQRFRSPEELRQHLGLPIVGHIPMIHADKTSSQDEDGAAALDPSLCAFHSPEHAASEAYRSVRTALYFSARGAGHRVIQVTSPVPGDGKTTLSANLAISAADSGKKVLLIEADFRRPRLGDIFALDEAHGVSSVIGRESELDEAIQQTPIENLSVMPCGPRPKNPSELLTSPRFQQLLDAARQQFDLILVDTPPLLAVTDPAVVAPRVDTVLLVVSLGRNVRYVANRAAEILDGIGANVLGVVVNRMDENAGYGNNQYGYRRGYRDKDSYRYGYTYASGNGNGSKPGNGVANKRRGTSGDLSPVKPLADRS
jgi:capsular exopolysaccharide synthesis family protein